jgi:hypothetical protein
MDSIFDLLVVAHQRTEFTMTIGMRLIAMFVFGLTFGGLGAVMQDPSIMLRQIRTALRMAGIADKEAAAICGVSKGNWSEKMAGSRPLTVQA